MSELARGSSAPPPGAKRRTVGVEENLLLVDRASGRAVAICEAALRTADEDADLSGGLQLTLLETGTRPCRDLGREVRRTRRQARPGTSRMP